MDTRGRQKLFMALTALLCLALLSSAVLLSVSYFTRGQNLRAVDMKKYAKVEMEDEVYTLSVDADAIIRDFHLPNPKTTSIDLSRFPDVATVYSLSFLVTPREEGGWLIQTGSDRADAAADLRRGGLKLVNTEWVWNEQDMKNAYREGLEYPRRISARKYVLCSKNTQGDFVLTMDHERLLRATGWDLPADESARKAHTGYKAVMSLGYYVTPLVEGFLVETSSTLENVYSMLLENGVRLTDTTWTYTLAEVETLYAEQHPEPEPTEPAETPAPEPGDGAETSEPSASSEAGGPDEQGRRKLAENSQALASLYHVDQTPARLAIQKAKEQRYGDSLQSSEVSYNAFWVGKNDQAEFGNCFRIVYTLKTKTGTEYLTADLYNLSEDAAPQAEDVFLTAAKSLDEAKALGAFSEEQYTLYELKEGSMAFPEDKGRSPFDENGFLFPDSLTDKIDEAQVWTLPIPEDMTLLTLLGYGRNEIFARNGNKFSDTSVYTRFYSQYTWFQPKGSVTYNAIKQNYPVAAENIDFLKTMEKLIKEG